MSDDVESQPQAYTVRLELVDRPGELLRALQPIADNGGNLLSILHERGNITPRGHIPVEIDLECPPDRFAGIVDALRAEDINVIQAGAEIYGEEVVVLLVGHLIDTDLSDTIEQIEDQSASRIIDFSMAAPQGTADGSSALVRLAVERGTINDTLTTIRSVVTEKEILVVEPADLEGDV